MCLITKKIFIENMNKANSIKTVTAPCLINDDTILWLLLYFRFNLTCFLI